MTQPRTSLCLAASRCGAALLLAIALGGCVGLAAGGAATGAAVAHDPRTTGTVVEDQAIELKAAHALNQDPEIAEQTHVNVTSYNQVVLLTGEAPTEKLRKRIADIVAGIEKVRHVHNEIQLAAPSSMMSRTNDTLLTTKVKTRLLTNDQIPGHRIKVVTENGTVYLLGFVSQAEQDLAAEIASTTSGVRRVVKLFE